MRATQTTTYRSLQSFLDRTTDKLQSLQLQAATGKRLNRPSDDPTAISPVLSARTQIQRSDRYLETIDSGLDRLDNMEGYLDRMENILVRAKEVTIASINGSLSSADYLTYADEMVQLRADLLDAGNAQVDGKYLFAGYSEKTKPFTASNPSLPISSTNPVVYNGDQGDLSFEISPNELISINITGDRMLLGDADGDGLTDPGAVDVFSVLTNLEEALRIGNTAGIEAELDNLEVGANQVRSLQSLKGNIGRRLENARDHMEQVKIDMEDFRSRYEDADILETITSMEQQQQSFQAALSVTGKVSELSILDYL